MLQYDWGTSGSSNNPNSQPVPIIEDTGNYEPDPTRTIYNHDPFNPPHFNDAENHFISTLNPFHNPPAAQNHQHYSANTIVYDAHQYGSAYPPLTLEPTGFIKPEPMLSGFEWVGGGGHNSNGTEHNNNASSSSRLGLNLGGRTFYAEADFVNRLYHRSRMLEPGSVNAPRCLAEGCNADLSYAKHYHRRHKVCEFHSKAATVIANGLTQRFCQQCSRFHILSEFDNGKRSCRRRLADHNRRRRKSQQPTNQECNNNNNNNKSQLGQNNNATHSSSENVPRRSSSVTVAVSPPRNSSTLFYSNG